MKLDEVARKHLTRNQYTVWYHRRIDNMEAEEVAKWMGISVATIYNLTFLATRELANHVEDIDDPDDYLIYMVSILRGHKVVNKADQTMKTVIRHEERAYFSNET